MTPRQTRFAQEYLVDLNATQAAIRAGYSARTAKQQGQRLLTNVDVAAAVGSGRADLARRTAVSAERVIQELARIGFADIRKAVRWQANVVGVAVDEDGIERLAVTNQVQLVDSTDLDDETAAAIAEISQSDKGGLKLKLHDKRAALVDLGRHLGLFDGEDDGGVAPVVNVNIALIDRPPAETREQWLERKARERALAAPDDRGA